ncbi:rRNA maturation RNase YbeY [bacterium]|nr:rRNA maturation RNase YbeY [bacterium]
MIEIEINSQSVIPVPFDAQTYLQRVIRILNIPAGAFEINFVDRDTIVSVNQRFLGRDYSTDIITFNLADEKAPIEGDVYICLDQVRDNAAELGHSFDYELKIVLIHGILHLLGYEDYTPEDKSVMDAEQVRIYEEEAKLIG